MTQERITVLLIDRDPREAKLIGQLLDKAGEVAFRVESAKDLPTGLDRLTGDRFDVVLLDLSLPDSQGLNKIGRAHV